MVAKVKKDIRIKWNDVNGVAQKIVLRRPKMRDMLQIQKEIMPLQSDEDDDDLMENGVRAVYILINMLKKDSTIPIENEEDLSNLDLEDFVEITDQLDAEFQRFLGSSPKLGRKLTDMYRKEAKASIPE